MIALVWISFFQVLASCDFSSLVATLALSSNSLDFVSDFLVRRFSFEFKVLFLAFGFSYFQCVGLR